MKNQLETDTYCVFATADKCKAAFKKARNLGLLHGMAFYEANEDMLYVDKDGLINSCLEANYLDPANKPKQKLSKISAAEFLPRMEGTWEQPIEQLTLPQAIAKLEAEGAELLSPEVIKIGGYKLFLASWSGLWYFQYPNICEPNNFPSAPAELQTAINACNTLNNAKPKISHAKNYYRPSPAFFRRHFVCLNTLRAMHARKTRHVYRMAQPQGRIYRKTFIPVNGNMVGRRLYLREPGYPSRDKLRAGRYRAYRGHGAERYL